LLLALACFNIYRAATQSFTTDEAFNYLNFASQPWAGLLAPYDANNHVLTTVLGRISASIFGVSEWSLRLPSVIGGGIYLFAAYRLCFLIFGGGAWSFLTMALLATNPFLLDHLSAARGYGIAIAFLLLGVYELMRAGAPKPPASLYRAGIFFALAIVANLTSLFPVAAFTLAYLAVSAAAHRFRWQAFWSQWVVPVALICLVALIVPLSRAKPDQFYFGARDWRDCIGTLANLSFWYAPVPWTPLSQLKNLFHDAVFPLVGVLLAAAVLCGGHILWKLRRGYEAERDGSEWNASIFCLAWLGVAALPTAAHLFAAVPYPLMRTSLYFVPLAFLTASSLLYEFRRLAAVRWVGAAAGTLCLVCFLAQANGTYYAEWRFDAGTRRVVDFIRTEYPRNPHLVIRPSWVLQPTLNFYRQLYHLNWAPVERDGPEKAGDLVILTDQDLNLASKLHLRILYQDPVSGEILGVPPQPR
jgi:hypothetical protein